MSSTRINSLFYQIETEDAIARHLYSVWDKGRGENKPRKLHSGDIKKIAFSSNLAFQSGIILHFRLLKLCKPFTKFRAYLELLWHFEETHSFRPLITIGNMEGHVGGHRIQKKIIKMFFLYLHIKRNTNPGGEVNFSEKFFF